MASKDKIQKCLKCDFRFDPVSFISEEPTKLNKSQLEPYCVLCMNCFKIDRPTSKKQVIPTSVRKTFNDCTHQWTYVNFLYNFSLGHFYECINCGLYACADFEHTWSSDSGEEEEEVANSVPRSPEGHLIRTPTLSDPSTYLNFPMVDLTKEGGGDEDNDEEEVPSSQPLESDEEEYFKTLPNLHSAHSRVRDFLKEINK